MQRDDDEPYSTRFGDPLGRYSLPSESHPQDDGLPAGAAEEDTDAALHRLFGNDGLASNEVVDAFGHDTVNGAQAAIDPRLQEHQDATHREQQQQQQQHQQQGHAQHAGDPYGENGGTGGHPHGYASAEGSMHSRGGSPADGRRRRRAQDGGLLDDGTEGDDGGVTKKRKASSRANMLTRGGACDYCKRRKLKCSAELPSCNQCLRSGKECIYSQKRQQSRVKILEDRLVELERRLGEQRTSHGDGGMAAGGDMTSHMDQTGSFGAGADFSLDLASSAAMDKTFGAAAAAAAGPYAPFNIDAAGEVLPMSAMGSTGFYDSETRTAQPSNGTSHSSPASAVSSNPFQGISATTSIRDPAGLILDTSQPLYDLKLSLPGLRFPDTPAEAHLTDPAVLDGHRASGAEPDLMTLADAAAADGSGRTAGPAGKYEWDSMPPEYIAASLARAVQGGHGVGEKILAHLIPFYCTAHGPLFTHFHKACDPKLYVARLRTGRPSTPHPSLTLSLLPLLLQYSPSPALSAPTAIMTISSLLLGPARALSNHAFASGDARIIDVVTSDMFRTMWLYDNARFLDGWVESSGGAAMVWAAGLGKLGNVSKGLLPSETRSPEEDERHRMEGSIRAFRAKTQVVKPASTLQEHAARIQLFWEVYHYSLAGAIGWDFPASFHFYTMGRRLMSVAFDLEEITTPWPRDSYDDPEAFRNETSMAEFLRAPAKGAADDCGTAMLFKTLTLAYRAIRLCDQPPGTETTKQRSKELLNITEQYMSAMPKPPGISADRFFSGPIIQSWVVGFATLTTLHARDEAEAPEGDKDLHFALCLAAMQNAVKYTHTQRADHADPDLDGFNLTGSLLVGVVGRTAYRLARRFQAAKDPASKRKYTQLTTIGEAMINAVSAKGTKSPFSAIFARMIENSSVGVDVNVGEYDRPDFVP